MADRNFQRFMSPDFQAPTQPQMAWMPWDDPQQAGDQLGSILGQLKPQGQSPAMGKGDMLGGGMEGKASPMASGGKGSL